MTRWKKEPQETLILLHAHNRMSRMNDYMLTAADQLGLVIGYRVTANHYDQSTDREWYCMTAQLETVGGLQNVKNLAVALRDVDLELEQSRQHENCYF